MKRYNLNNRIKKLKKTIPSPFKVSFFVDRENISLIDVECFERGIYDKELEKQGRKKPKYIG